MTRVGLALWLALLGACGIVDPSDRSGEIDGPAFAGADAAPPPDAATDGGVDASNGDGPDGSPDAAH